MTDRCRTRYPILMVHGIGYSDSKYPEYWGRIPQALKEQGAHIYFGDQDGFRGIIDNARQIRRNMVIALEDSKAEKMNIIAHSKGGIEARYLISELGMADRTASLTTLATPHRGLKSIDLLKEKVHPLYNRLADLLSLMIALDGGDKFADREVYDQLSADYMEVFNEIVKDAEGVYYQSYAFDMVSGETDPAMALFHGIVEGIEGENDGLVSVESAKWGEFRGVFKGAGDRGISHSQAVDGEPEQIEKENGEYIINLYIELVSELKKKGF